MHSLIHFKHIMEGLEVLLIENTQLFNKNIERRGMGKEGGGEGRGWGGGISKNV